MTAVRHIYSGRIIDLRVEDAVLPNGATVSLEIIRHPGAAAVVAIDDARTVTLIHQYRHAAGGFIWEVPAGVLRPGEDPARCAARELREETGLLAEEFTPLGSILTTPGFCTERIHLFLARRLRLAEQQLEHDEVLSVRPVALSHALDLVRTAVIEDAKTIAALHRAAAYLHALA